MPVEILACDFKATFPEFTDAPDDLVTRTLAFAATKVPEDVWGDSTEEGRMLWTAKILATSPQARKIGFVGDKESGETTYDKRLTQLLRAVAPRGVAL